MNLLRVFFVISLSAAFSFAQTKNRTDSQNPNEGDSVTHVRTVIGHVSLLEFKEPVTAAAAGSKNFHIERFENKVLITPTKTGASTNLFVWTATQRFSYELDAPGETSSGSLAVDAPGPQPKSVANVAQQPSPSLARTILGDGKSGLRRIDSSSIKPIKGSITLRVDQVLETSDTLYIHFSVDNESTEPFRLTSPSVDRLVPTHSTVSLWSFVNHQIDSRTMARVGATKEMAIPISDAEFQTLDIPARSDAAGVIAIHLTPVSPTILQLNFSDGMRATFGL